MDLFEIWALVISAGVIAVPIISYFRKMHREHKELEKLFL